MCRRFLGLLVLWGVLLLASGAGAPFLFASPDRCPELVTDYSLLCRDGNLNCGSFCFYAICLDCENASHGDHCALCTGSHQYEISPCIEWIWRLYGRGVGFRDDNYVAPNFGTALEFGLVPADYELPVNPCVTERGTEYIPPGGLSPGPRAPFGTVVAPDNRIHVTSGTVPHPSEVTISDMTHLPTTPGEPGAPVIVSIGKSTDRDVLLTVGGGPPVLFHEYRYWSYNGGRHKTVSSWEASPSAFRVPFKKFDGRSFGVWDVRGIVSFQVRGIDLDGNPTGLSNIVHEMIGMSGFQTIEPIRDTLRFQPVLPPTPPHFGTPVPTPIGYVPPPRAVIASAHQLPSPPEDEGTVEVVMAQAYSGTIQYRWWAHSGFDAYHDWNDFWPAFFSDTLIDDWRTADMVGRTFKVSDILPDGFLVPAFEVEVQPTRLPGGTPVPHPPPTQIPDHAIPYETPEELEQPSPSVFNFQTRLLGNSLISSEPSDIMVVFVWPGEYQALNIGYAGAPPTPLPVTPTPLPTPTAAPGPALHPDCGLAVTSIEEIELSYDCAVMLSFKDALQGGVPSLNWSRTIPIRSWTGVLVSDYDYDPDLPESYWVNPRVARIHLPNRGLNGVVPQRLSLLDRLEHLDLSNNSLGGPVPRFDTTGFDRLVTLYLGGNNLSGSFPDVSGLDSLQYLRLNDNVLTGTPLRRLEYLDTLIELDIRNNLLTGRVINFRYHSPLLSILLVSGNAMTGCYPSMLVGILLNDVETLGLDPCPSSSRADELE